MRQFIFTFLLFFSAKLLAAVDTVEDLQTFLNIKNYTQAIKLGEQLLAEQPQSVQVRFLTAYAYQMNRRNDEAERLYRQIIERQPALPEPRNNLALIYQARGDYDAASKLLVEAINTHPSYATAYQNLNRIYTGIASEAYRRALSESEEPANYTHKIELAALSRLEPLAQSESTVSSVNMETIAPNPAGDVNAILRRQLKLWAEAWSKKDFATYTGFYSTEHRPNFDTHSEWVEYRRQRMLRPGFIKIGVSDIHIRVHNNNQAIIDFKQSFDSPGYSDRVKKRLALRRVGTQWKITDERVLSVL